MTGGFDDDCSWQLKYWVAAKAVLLQLDKLVLARMAG